MNCESIRYIVDNTVGKFIEGKSPTQIANLRFADIACGSGSFLLGVFDCLLRYLTRWYNENPERAKKDGCIRTNDGAWRLSLHQRRLILVNNIYGADIDPQAIEVTQLALYLKLLEDESTSSAHQHQLEFHETLLPPLSKNIACGNSVIGSDILNGQLFAGDEEKALNPMDFDAAFPQILKGGGFDAIVGNPPYVRPHKIQPVVKEYFWRTYNTFTQKSDLYCCFIERASQLLREHGMFGYIVSHGWLRLNSFRKLRRLILEQFAIRQLVELPFKVFTSAAVETGLIISERQQSPANRKSQIDVVRAKPAMGGEVKFDHVKKIPQAAFYNTFENVFDLSISKESDDLKAKMRAGPSIGQEFDVCFGLKTADDKKFLHHSAGLHKEDRPLLRGDDVKRYGYDYKGELVWYVPGRMRKHRRTARPGEPARFEQPKVLVKDTSKDFAGTFEDRNFYVKDVLIIIPHAKRRSKYDLKFVTGVVNSRALRFYYRTTFQTLHVQRGELSSLPLPPINFANANDRRRHDRIVALVEQMLDAKREESKVRSDRDRDYWARRSETLDRQIDRAVYDLYGMEQAEVDIIETAIESLSESGSRGTKSRRRRVGDLNF